jgi:hypothetical protein
MIFTLSYCLSMFDYSVLPAGPLAYDLHIGFISLRYAGYRNQRSDINAMRDVPVRLYRFVCG